MAHGKGFKGSESRNPYFIGINSAISVEANMFIRGVWSQSLFYWN